METLELENSQRSPDKIPIEDENSASNDIDELFGGTEPKKSDHNVDLD
jgi:hypothetical protein